MENNLYELNPYCSNSFSEAWPQITPIDFDIKKLVQELDLLHLYHLDRLGITILRAMGKAIQMEEDNEGRRFGSDYSFPEKIPTEDEIRSLLQRLEKMYPQSSQLMDFDLLARDVLSARTVYQEKRKVIPTASLQRFEQLLYSVRQTILEGPWDSETRSKTFLGSFTLGTVNHGEEEALI
jgi:hypothetical protein